MTNIEERTPRPHHGHGANGGKRTPTYYTWNAMRSRCLNPKDASWRWYGARGVTICERWLDFRNFLADMGERPKGRTLDRIDHDHGYEPGNCRWATPLEQTKNRRKQIKKSISNCGK